MYNKKDLGGTGSMLTFSLNTTDRDICDALQLIMGFNTNAETEREWLGTAF